MKQTAIEQLIEEIKQYTKSLDKSNNSIYKDNELLILSCMSKCMELAESLLPIEKQQIVDAYYAYELRKEESSDGGETFENVPLYENAEQYFENTFKK